MATNPYFLKNQSNEIALFQSLVTESIQVIGHDVYYLPRSLQKLDLILGEDSLSKFDVAIPVEMYMKKDQWVADQDMLSKFGLMADDTITYTISRPRWESIIARNADRLHGFNRPQEGDLVYESMNKNLYEITYVDRDTPYYQFGQNNLMYVLKCKPYTYSSERLTTGIAEIDDIATEEVTADLFNFQITTEDGSLLTQESGKSVIIDSPEGNKNFDKTSSFNIAAKEEQWSANDPFADNR